MAIFELFSERKRKLEQAGKADVYQYTDAPQALRNQISQIAIAALGYARIGNQWRETSYNETWQELYKILCREWGVNAFGSGDSGGERVIHVLLSGTTEQFLDVLELILRAIDFVARDWDLYRRQSVGVEQDAESAVEEVNYRLRRAGFGYQYEEGHLVRTDSQFLHADVVKPALTLLGRRGYEGPQAEFIQAHEHYREGRNKEAITEAAKAFESMMKAVCDKKGWVYQKGSRASDLLKVLKRNRLWPDYLDASFDQLLATLASGLPQVRNEEGAHGQGAIPKNVPAYVAGYALHLAASKIVLIGEAAG